jgi:hypothetical protein
MTKPDPSNSIHDVAQSKRKLAVILILITDIGMLLWGGMAAIFPEYLLGPSAKPILPAEYEGYTQLSWSMLVNSTPRVAQFMTILFRMYGIFNAVFGFMAIAITLYGFRKGQRWAWWTLLVANVLAIGSAITFDRIVKAIGLFELTEYLGLAMVVVALLITWPSAKKADTKPHSYPAKSRSKDITIPEEA